ncbi:MAG: hypothetical protein B7Z80_03680 [Rhodospirillales bacterium 20-64-7]|nr:MAG: hypothetical protein B7Z80_03680 [Rhodospirillales bacterium 20-64-7]
MPRCRPCGQAGAGNDIQIYFDAEFTLLRGGAKNAMPGGAMRVTCPNCSTEYEVPDAALAGRNRKLLCERCGHRWLHADVPPRDGGEPVQTIAARAEPRLQMPAPEAETSAGESRAEPPDREPFVAEPSSATPIEPVADATSERAVTIHAAENAPEDRLPLFLTERHPDDAVLMPGTTASDGQDRFADLVHAARNNRVEYEPLVPRDARQRATSPVAIICIIILLLAAVVLWDHALLARNFPAARPFLARFGLH